MDVQRKIAVDYAHPTPRSDREAEIIARIDYLDAKKKVHAGDGDADGLAAAQAELDALCAEWDAGRKADE